MQGSPNSGSGWAGHVSHVLCLLSHKMGPLLLWGILVVGKKDKFSTLCTWNIDLIDRSRIWSGHTLPVESETLLGLLVSASQERLCLTPLFPLVVEAMCFWTHLLPPTGQEK